MTVFEHVKESIEEYSALEFCKNGYEVDREALPILKQYCDLIDEIVSAEERCELEIEMDVFDGIRISITVRSFCYDFWEGKYVFFPKLVQRMKSFKLEPTEDGLIKMTMGFPSVWNIIPHRV